MNHQPSSIDDLADDNLAHIFQYLPPVYRLRVSEVCKRWLEISRLPWRDVLTIDLTPIPCQHFRAIIKQCPRLQTVITSKYGVHRLSFLSRINLSSLKMYNCEHTLAERDGAQFDLFSAMFSENLRNASWDELVLHGVKASINVEQFRSLYGCSVVGTLPSSLKRLQLSGGFKVKFLGFLGEFKPTGCSILDRLWHLPNLTCLILCSTSAKLCLLEALYYRRSISQLKMLTGLIELCIGWSTADWHGEELHFVDVLKICYGFPKLQVLFLHNFCSAFGSAAYLEKLLTEHVALRILAFTGGFGLGGIIDEVVHPVIPARRLYPNGFRSAPVPLLHVFLGKEASEDITFTKSSSEALRIHPITESLPSFLAKEEIAPIFADVWIAGQITEGAKYGAKLCEPEREGPATSVRILDPDE